MNRNIIVACAATTAILAGLVWLLANGDATKTASAQAAEAGAKLSAQNVGLAPQNVLAIRANAPKPSAAVLSVAVKGASASAPYKESELARSRRMGESAQALLARIAQLPNDGEALRMRAEILGRCAKVKNDEWVEALKDNKRYAEAEKLRKADPRAAFLNGLPTDQPDYAARIAAFDRLNINPRYCEGLEEKEITKEELDALYASAAKLGDVPSIAKAFACDIASAMPKSNPNSTFAEELKREPVKIELTPARQEQLQDLLRAGHPESIRYLMWAMNVKYSNVNVKLPGAPEENSIGHYTYRRALEELVTCDLGKPCAGANTPALDRRCAYQGQCGLNSIPDAIHFHELSPAVSQSVEKARQTLRDAIVTGSFSEMKFEPVKANASDVFSISNQSAGEEIGCRR